MATTTPLQLGEELKPALRLFHPYLGLQNWKYHENLSAFTHSLSTAYHTRGLYRVLTRCGAGASREDLAFHAGLVHDLAQKAGELGFDPNARRRLLERAYHDHSPSLVKVLSTIVAGLNLAENPQMSIGGDRMLSIALRLADLLQARGVDSLFQAIGLLEPLRSRGLLDYTIYSVGLPQPAVRALISTLAVSRAVEHVETQTSCAPHVILTREGAIVVHPPDAGLHKMLRPLTLRWDELRIEGVETQLLDERDTKVWSKKLSQYKERLYASLSLTYPKQDKPVLHQEVEGALLNIRLDGVQYSSDGDKHCLSCGLPLPKGGEMPAQLLGYSLYSKAVTEMWNNRYRPHVNMNRLYTSRSPPRVCLLCVMDALLSLDLLARERSAAGGRPRHYLVYTFTKPAPLELLNLTSTLMMSPQFTVTEKGPAVGRFALSELPEILSKWLEHADEIHEFIVSMQSPQGVLDYTMTDLSTATVFKEAGVYRARDGSIRYLFTKEPHKDLARLTPYVGGLLILTQSFPYKIAPTVDPLIPDALLGLPFNAPLVTYPPREMTRLPPYTASLLASLHTVAEASDRLRLLEEPPGFAPVLLLSLEPKGRDGGPHEFFRLLQAFETSPLQLYA